MIDGFERSNKQWMPNRWTEFVNYCGLNFSLLVMYVYNLVFFEIYVYDGLWYGLKIMS